jgi:hypothetical protein
MFEIMGEKSNEMAHGYGDPDPFHIYQTGWDTWLPFLAKDYGSPWFLGFLMFSVIFSVLTDRRHAFPTVLLGWVLVMGGYLIYFVAVKSYQYGLPVFLPLFGCLFLIPQSFQNNERLASLDQSIYKVIVLAVYLIGLTQLAINIRALF